MRLLSDEEIGQIFNKLYPEVSPFMPNNIPESYFYVIKAQAELTRTETLKEVGRWLESKCTHNPPFKGIAVFELTDIDQGIEALLKGEMPGGDEC